VAYGYDAVSRLTSETITADPRGTVGNGQVEYTLDPTGNRLTRTSTLAALGAQTFSYDANDQLTTDLYDANGNTTSSDGHTYTYDFENQLTSKDAGAVKIVYDGDGNRVAKTVGGLTTKYLVDDLNPTGYVQVLEEVSGGAVQVVYAYGTTVVSQTRTPGVGGETSYYGYDARGNVAFLTDSTGAVTDTYDYDAFGNLLAATGATVNSRLFGGEELDPDLGLINLRARQYRPASGRFLTIDPAMGESSNPLSFNRYLYAGAEPLGLSDPLGLFYGPPPPVKVNSGLEYAALLGIAATLVVAHEVALGTEGKYTTVTDGTVVATGDQAACSFWKAWSAMEMLEAVSQCRLPTPPPPPYQNCKSDCEDEWAAATQRCCDLIDNPGKTPRERAERRRLRGGHMTVYECARGYVSERCGGNDIDWGPNAPN
jgi:RHS repeat-associated protein